MNIFDYESAILKIKLLIYNFANPKDDIPGDYLGDIHELLNKPVYHEMDWLVRERGRLNPPIQVNQSSTSTTWSGNWATAAPYALTLGDTTTTSFKFYNDSNNSFDIWRPVIENPFGIKKKKKKKYFRSKAAK
jgi:hypothetical protein